jgi:hypothetical protein
MTKRSSYRKLKERVAQLESEVRTLVHEPDSVAALEIKLRDTFKRDVERRIWRGEIFDEAHGCTAEMFEAARPKLTVEPEPIEETGIRIPGRNLMAIASRPRFKVLDLFNMMTDKEKTRLILTGEMTTFQIEMLLQRLIKKEERERVHVDTDNRTLRPKK